MDEQEVKLVRTVGDSAPFDPSMYAGIDEVGVSSIAGPMVAAVVILPKFHGIKELPVDSKLLQTETIQRLAREIAAKAIHLNVYEIEANVVDQIGTNGSRKKLWEFCALSIRDPFPNVPIVIDGQEEIPHIANQQAVVAGDAKFDNVSAAAILSTACCDSRMNGFHNQYPDFNFARNKGYPTREHLLAIEKYGLCRAHRDQMAMKRLEQGIPVQELHLSKIELRDLLSEITPILRAQPHYADEWSLNFLRQQYQLVMINDKSPTPRQQYFIKKCRDDILKRFEKEQSRIKEGTSA